MEIRKFKNGKIKFELEKNYDIVNGEISENIYHNDMFMSDLSFNQINGYTYLVDYNTQLVYESGEFYLMNPLKYLMDEMKNKGKMYLYALTKKDSESLLQDLENGF